MGHRVGQGEVRGQTEPAEKKYVPIARRHGRDVVARGAGQESGSPEHLKSAANVHERRVRRHQNPHLVGHAMRHGMNLRKLSIQDKNAQEVGTFCTLFGMDAILEHR